MKKKLLVVLAFLSVIAMAADIVKVSSFGFNAEDSTVYVQKAIDSGVKTVVLDNMGKPWIVCPILLRSNLELVLEDNVLVLAKPGEFKDNGDCLFRAGNAKNIIIRGGKNSEMRMWKKDYQDASNYAPSEWRHLLAFFSCENVTVKDLTLKSSGGDGIYLGGDKGPCKNILTENLILDDHHRSAFSVISVRNLLARNCVMSNTSGTAPQDGFSLEPNREDEEETNIVFENCESFGNAGAGSYLHNWTLTAGKFPPISVTFKNCYIHDNGQGAFFANPLKPGKDSYTGTFDFIGCTFESKKERPLRLNGCTEDGVKFTFKDCRVIVGKECDCAISFTTENSAPFGNVDLGNMRIIDEVNRDPFSFGNFKSQGISTLTGAPTYKVGKNGTPRNINLVGIREEHQADPELRKLLKTFSIPPFTPDGYKAEFKGTGNPNGYELCFREENRFLQCVPKGQTARIRIKVRPYGEENPKVTVAVTDKSGVSLPSIELTREERIVELKAEHADQVYVLTFRTSNNVNVCSDAPGHGMVATSVSLIRSDSLWYFYVPGDCEDVKIMVNAPFREYVTAELFDASGKLVCKLNQLEGFGLLHGKRKKTAAKEMWSMKFSNAVEDYSFILGAPLEPVIFTAPENSIVK